MRTLATFALFALLTAPAAAAQSAGIFVSIEDAEGDSGVAGGSWDIVRVTFSDETPEHILVRIEMMALESEPAWGEVAIHFRVGDRHWLTGWTVVPLTSPPFMYRGGFYCATDSAGTPDIETCTSMSAHVADGAYEIMLDRSAVGASDSGTAIEDPWAYAHFGQTWDSTDVGRAYRFGNTSEELQPNDYLDGAGASTADESDAAAPLSPEDSPVEGAPGLVVPAILAVSVILAATLRRRRR